MKEIYRLNNGYLPRIYENEGKLIYEIPVDSSFVSITKKFAISEDDFLILKSDEYRFRILNFFLFHEIQTTFGPTHKSPRDYTQDEFEIFKHICLYRTNQALEKYIEEFINSHNLSKASLEKFLKN